MATLDDLLAQFDADRRARGMFPGDPSYALAAAAGPSIARFGNVDAMQAARDFLQRGTTVPPVVPEDPTSAALLQGQQPNIPVSETGGAMLGTSPLGSPDMSLGGRVALAGELGRHTSPTSLGFDLLSLAAPPPFGFLAPAAKLAMGRHNQAALDAGLRGLGLDQFNPEIDLAGLTSMLSGGANAGPQFAFSGSPTGFVGSTPPAASSPFGISSVSGLGGFTAPGGVFGGSQDPTLDIEAAMATGSPPGAGPTGSAPGVSAGTGPGEGPGQAPYRGGYLDGPRRKTRKVPEAHGGEFVMNASATDRFRPWLETMNAAVQPDERMDRLLDRARDFWKDA